LALVFLAQRQLVYGVTQIGKTEKIESERTMTIDERLEKLAERHEALTPMVELMAAENRAGFARLQHVEQILGQLAQSIDTCAGGRTSQAPNRRS
jgi:hypothetical protein